MRFRIIRKTFRIGQSHCVTLPPGWCAFYGERVKTVTILGHSLLIIAPQGLEDLAQKMIEDTEITNKHEGVNHESQ